MVLNKYTYFFVLSLLLLSCDSDDNTQNEEVRSSARSGEVLYKQNCAACHGDDGKLGAGGAMDLSKLDLSDQNIEDIILNGRKGMPSFSFVFESDEEVQNVITFIRKFESKK
jgi:mono/diheme cytochrome c family protein